ncbi:MAG: GNAT family N-acetyltransferase [Nitrospirales bacterium]|nr:GNAT family N-acetyltransferase [Nitrospira sp.]MDR4500709.1 GNAT family N-acetyltransferase [Nitrospirales bacterium]
MTAHSYNDIVVRRAVQADIPLLVEFNAAMARETEERSLNLETLEAGIQGVFEDPSRGFYLVGEIPQEQTYPVLGGQLLITYEWSDWRNGNFWWIQSVYVHQNWRKQGIFRALYRYVLTQAQARADVCGVRLYVEKNNALAQTVYAKMGLHATSYRFLERDFVLSAKLVDSKDTP